MRFLFLVAACLLICCATPYQPKGFGGGYEDVQIDETTFEVAFRGNGFTSAQRVRLMLLYRCAELTTQHAYDYFLILGAEGEVLTHEVQLGSDRFSGSSQSYGGTTRYSGTYHAAPRIPVRRYSNSVLIRVLRREGDAPPPPGALEARSVISHLALQISR